MSPRLISTSSSVVIVIAIEAYASCVLALLFASVISPPFMILFTLVVFPEGSRTWNGKLQRFKKGAYQLAIDLNLPVVPLTIDGSFSVLPRSSYLIKPGKMILTIHKPLFPDPISVHDIETLMKKSYEAVESALPKEETAL